MSEDKDDKPDQEKKMSPKHVVVTYGEKKKKKEDIPSEILPQTPSQVVASPVDSGGVAPVTIKTTVSAPKPAVSHLHPRIPEIPEEIFPRPPQRELPPLRPPPPPSASYAPPPPPPSASDKSQTASSSSGMALFLSLLTTIAIVGLMVYSYFSQQQLNQLQQQSRNDKTSIATLLAQAKGALNEMEAVQRQHAMEQQVLHTLKSQLEKAQIRLVTLKGDKDWVLSEVSYLAGMANERLRMAKDVSTAAAQLKAADDKIKALNDPAFGGVKAALAKDIATLQNYTPIDKQILWEQLGNLNAQLDQLHFKTIENDVKNKKEEEPASSIESTQLAWKKALWASWLELKSLIRITKEDESSIPAALTFEEKRQILRTLQLMTEQAQWALLNENKKIYLDSLQSMQTSIQQYFSADALRQGLLNHVAQLQKEPMETAMPEITQTLQALSKAAQQRGSE